MGGVHQRVESPLTVVKLTSSKGQRVLTFSIGPKRVGFQNQGKCDTNRRQIQKNFLEDRSHTRRETMAKLFIYIFS